VLWCGDATQFDQQLVSYIFSVMTRDALLTSHPVSAEIRDPDDITLYFDAISYDKVSPVGGGERAVADLGFFRGGGDFGNPSERCERALRGSGLTGE